MQNSGHCIDCVHYVADKRTKCDLLQNKKDILEICEIVEIRCVEFIDRGLDKALKEE